MIVLAIANTSTAVKVVLAAATVMMQRGTITVLEGHKQPVLETIVLAVKLVI